MSYKDDELAAAGLHDTEDKIEGDDDDAPAKSASASSDEDDEETKKAIAAVPDKDDVAFPLDEEEGEDSIDDEPPYSGERDHELD